MKETKKVYALNSKRIVLTMKSPLSKAKEIKNGGGSLRYKSEIHYKRKFKIKNVIAGAEYNCGDCRLNFTRDFYTTWRVTLLRTARFRKQQKLCATRKKKGMHRNNDNE